MILLSEQRELRLFQLDALASLVVILLVELEPDEVALLFYTSNGGGAAAHTVIQYGVALVGVGANEVLKQLNRLCRRVQLLFVSVEFDDVYWEIVFSVVTSINYTLPFGVVVTITQKTTMTLVWFPTPILRIIHHRFVFVFYITCSRLAKHTNIFMYLHWSKLAIQMSSATVFFPYPFVLEHLLIAHYKHRRERLLTE